MCRQSRLPWLRARRFTRFFRRPARLLRRCESGLDAPAGFEGRPAVGRPGPAARAWPASSPLPHHDHELLRLQEPQVRRSPLPGSTPSSCVHVHGPPPSCDALGFPKRRMHQSDSPLPAGGPDIHSRCWQLSPLPPASPPSPCVQPRAVPMNREGSETGLPPAPAPPDCPPGRPRRRRPEALDPASSPRRIPPRSRRRRRPPVHCTHPSTPVPMRAGRRIAAGFPPPSVHSSAGLPAMRLTQAPRTSPKIRRPSETGFPPRHVRHPSLDDCRVVRREPTAPPPCREEDRPVPACSSPRRRRTTGRPVVGMHCGAILSPARGSLTETRNRQSFTTSQSLPVRHRRLRQEIENPAIRPRRIPRRRPRALTGP